jgi:hypothetical protein
MVMRRFYRKHGAALTAIDRLILDNPFVLFPVQLWLIYHISFLHSRDQYLVHSNLGLWLAQTQIASRLSPNRLFPSTQT